MNKLTQIVMEQTIAGKIDVKVGTELLKILKLDEGKPQHDDIAIIGMALQFPQAKNKIEFWNNLHEGVDAVGEYPHSRRPDTEAFVPYTYFKDRELRYSEGGYLEDIDLFDYQIFRLTPKEASLLDPHQRLFLQTAWEAIEDAGYGGEKLVGSSTGVYVGYNGWPIYGQFIPQMDPESAGISTAGNLSSIIASRISYLLNLRGPALTVDTACSSSLVAVHLAAQAIKQGECEMALAGGVKVNLLPLDGSTDIGIESSSNRTKSFDDSSDGTVWGEGVAALLLKPLSKAQKDGDHIYATIKGSATNQDGASIGITAPNMVAQTEVIEKAWEAAGIDPETISYVEAHGTGTKLGDPIEIDALTKAFRKHTGRKQFCAVGSVKSNIGHLDNVAGLSGLIKAVLALQHKKLPPTLHFEKPNRKIQFENSPLYVVDRLTEWQAADHPRRCGISSFGMSGTNCHIVLEEAPATEPVANEGTGPQVLALSAKTRTGLQRLVRHYHAHLLAEPTLSLADICATANTGRGHHEHRLFLVVETKAELEQKLHQLGQAFDSLLSGVLYGTHKLVSDDKEVRQPGEITELEKRDLSAQVQALLSQLASAGQQAERFAALGRLYVQGANVDWEALYPAGSYRKVTLPTYPFELERCWIEDQMAPTTSNVQAQTEPFDVRHPLLHRLVFQRADQEIYSTELQVKTHWMLEEHRIAGTHVIPGTTYLELARAAALTQFPDSNISLDLLFVSPLVVVGDEQREIQSVVDYRNGQAEINISSKGQDQTGEYDSIQHAEGTIRTCNLPRPAAYDIVALKAKAERTYMVGDPNGTRGSMEFGRRWFALQDVYQWGAELLGYHELGDEFLADLNDYYLHPALMDLAVNIDMGSDGQYLPLQFKNMHVYGPTPAKFYAYIRRKETNGTSNETISFEISLLDENGDVFVEIEEYTIKKVYETELRSRVLQKNSLFYQMGWLQQTRPTALETTNGAVLLLADERGLATQLRESLVAAGRIVVEVRHGDGYQKLGENRFVVGGSEAQYQHLAEELKNYPFSDVFHLFTLQSDVQTLSGLQQSQAKGFESLYYLARTLFKGMRNQHVQVLLVGDNVYEVSGTETSLNPSSATLFGLGKVIDKEFPNVSVLSLDIDEHVTGDQLLAESQAERSFLQVALREGQRYIQEFRAVDIEAFKPEALELKEQGVYVITGGTGGLGLAIAAHFAAQKNVNLALLNRSTLPPREQWEALIADGENPGLAAKLSGIIKLEQMGSRVSCHALNVASEADIHALFEQLRAEYGAINGIIHAAGVAGDGFIVKKDERTWREVVSPKIEGTWVLHQETLSDALDFFVNFSSVASLLGTAGQSDYASGNSYLDAFSTYRTRLGHRTLSINWPAWKETGMAANLTKHNDRGAFQALSTADALASFNTVLNKQVTNMIIGDLNHSFMETYETRLGIKLSDEIKQLVKKKSNQTHATKETMHVQIKGKAESVLSDVERTIAHVWSDVLGLREIDVYDSFYAIGGDSIQATKLYKKLDQMYPGTLSISDLFSYSTVTKMAEFIESKLNPEHVMEPLQEAVTSLEGDDLDNILDMLESGEMSIDDIDNIIKNS